MAITFPTGRTRTLNASGSLVARYARYSEEQELSPSIGVGQPPFEKVDANPSFVWQGAAASASLSFVTLRNGDPVPVPSPYQSTDTYGAALTLTVGAPPIFSTNQWC
jgi:hypothetical protein